jgi:hypothetical protein
MTEREVVLDAPSTRLPLVQPILPPALVSSAGRPFPKLPSFEGGMVELEYAPDLTFLPPRLFSERVRDSFPDALVILGMSMYQSISRWSCLCPVFLQCRT